MEENKENPKMQNTWDCAYLEEAESLIFRACGVFGCTLAPATRIASRSSPICVLRIMHRQRRSFSMIICYHAMCLGVVIAQQERLSLPLEIGCDIPRENFQPGCLNMSMILYFGFLELRACRYYKRSVEQSASFCLCWF